MSKNIIHTKPGDSSFHLFRSLEKELYPAGSIRQKQSDGINHEFLHTCLVYLENDKPMARLALYFNPSLRYNDTLAACIGNYESVDDSDIPKELITCAEGIAKRNACRYVIGPMNGSTWDSYRFSMHNDHPNFFLEPYHHLYYNENFISAGYKPVAVYYSMLDRTMDDEKAEVKKREKELIEMGVTFRSIDLDNYEGELDRMHEFSMKAFRNNFLFTPLSLETFRNKYLPLKNFITPGHVLIAQQGEQTVGLAFCIDDHYSKEPVLIFKTLARDNNKAYSGLGNVLGNMMTRYAKENGYKAVIHAFMLGTNASRDLSKQYSGEYYKHYQLYGKEL